MTAIREKYQNLIIAFLIIGIGLFYNWERLNEFPSNIHAWAQADRYAIALGFIDNGFDFFHPQTYVLNKQFPGEFKVPSENGITAVDFPIHDYLVAIFMNVLNTRSPWCFRFYTLIYSFFGLFFLFKLSKLLGNHFVTSVLLTIFAASSPVFAYYQAGFLPTMPSLANTIIGIYLYLSYLQTKRKTSFYWSIFFLSLATLSRTTFLLAFSSLAAYEFLSYLKNPKIKLFKIMSFAAGLLAIFSYFFYNNYLRDSYGSMFMNKLLPPENLVDAFKLISISLDNWLFHYFTESQYFIIIVLLISFVFLYRHKPVPVKNSSYNYSSILWLILIYLLACFCFLIALMRQYPEHDYYFIDTFYLPINLLLIYALSKIKISFNKKPGLNHIIVIFIILLLLINTKLTDNSRRKTGYWDRTAISIKNFRTAGPFFDSISLANNAKIFVVDATAPNIPFILMNRRGYNSMECSKSFFIHAHSWNYDYLVSQTEFILSDIYKKYPEFINNYKKIADNGYLSIFKQRELPIKLSLEEFLTIDNKKPIFSDTINFESEISVNWENIFKNDSFSVSGNYAAFVGSDMEFGLSFRKKDFSVLNHRSSVLKFAGNFLSPNHKLFDCNLVVSVNSDDKTVYYQLVDISEGMDAGINWKHQLFYFILPKFDEANPQLSVYIWNTGKNQLYYDDLRIEVF